MPLPPRPSHKPRKKGSPSGSHNGTVTTNPATNRDAPSTPLAAFFWPARTSPVSQWLLLPAVLMVAGLFRWCTALWPYSGMGYPPMHGDFEAQRHWMEITANLPMTHWYFHDLEWWGLDYPPLTAYHSWLLGEVGALIQESWFALYLSRGLDDPDLKVFMRATVAVSEYLIYIPAAVVCVRYVAKRCGVGSWDASIALTAVLMQPATILIDHGHFQYNTVMLGFFLITIASLLAGRQYWSWACISFVCALGFKQMALFYAPGVAAYLAGMCFFPRIVASRLLGIAVITLASFALLFLPLLIGTWHDLRRGVSLPSDATIPPLLYAIPLDIPEDAWYHPYLVQLTQCIHRIFPFSRGLFEDKVANIWCAIHSSGLHKMHTYPATTLSRAALALTAAATVPPCAYLLLNPRKSLLLPALATSAWAFFLCSYQVHEKNVLLPLLPTTLLLATNAGMEPLIRAWVGYANVLACWTMFPLLARDELRIPYFILTGLWAYLLGLPPFSFAAYTARRGEGGLYWPTKVIHLGTYAVIVGWHGVEYFVAPPPDKPDLWLVANACLGAAGFGLCYLWCLGLTVRESGGGEGSTWAGRPVLMGDKKRQ